METAGAIEMPRGAVAGTVGSTSAAAEAPEAVASRTAPSEGAVKEALPVPSVITFWSLPRVTVTPEASRPCTPITASVAGWPATIFGGSTIVTVQALKGVDCACAGKAERAGNKKPVRKRKHMARDGRSRSENGMENERRAVIFRWDAPPAHTR